MCQCGHNHGVRFAEPEAVSSYSTVEQVGQEIYCVYCGKKAKVESGSYHHNEPDTYYCDCADALEDRKIQQTIAALKSSLNAMQDRKRANIDRVRRDYEIAQVKAKYAHTLGKE